MGRDSDRRWLAWCRSILHLPHGGEIGVTSLKSPYYLPDHEVTSPHRKPTLDLEMWRFEVDSATSPKQSRVLVDTAVQTDSSSSEHPESKPNGRLAANIQVSRDMSLSPASASTLIDEPPHGLYKPQLETVKEAPPTGLAPRPRPVQRESKPILLPKPHAKPVADVHKRPGALKAIKKLTAFEYKGANGRITGSSGVRGLTYGTFSLVFGVYHNR